MLRLFSHVREQVDASSPSKSNENAVILVRRAQVTPELAKMDAQRFVVDLLAATQAMDYEDLVSRLALFLYRKELTIGGWALDLGVLGRSLFVSEARHELELGKGILWEIVPARKDSDELLSNLSQHDQTPLPGGWRRLGGGTQNRRAPGSGGGGYGA